jgi:hypothetical protein
MELVEETAEEAVRKVLLALARICTRSPPAGPTRSAETQKRFTSGDDVGIIHSQPYDHCKTLPFHRHCLDWTTIMHGCT